MTEYIIPISETKAIRFVSVGDPIVGIPQRYELVKPDGTRSSAGEWNQISRLQGHFGGRIVKEGDV